jgi:pyruvate/2-oxoglutarate dehydrogenase complex dihydrolipoamide acyltransferase (E2) component
MAGDPDGAGGSAAADVTARAGTTLAKPATSRIHLVLSQLIDQLKMPHAPGKTQPYPRLRNFLQDALAEGKRKHIAHIVLEADIGGVKERLAQLRQRGEEPVSMTSYIAKSFACAIETDKRMQAYRLGKSRLMVFDDIDLAFMIEREWEGQPIPVFSILRAAQQKSAAEIHRALQAAKETPLGTDGPMNALEMQFFLLPRFLRKAVWFVIRRNPYWFKDVAGTAAVTSMGMYTAGAAVGIPITPMTLTLTIGTIEKKPALQDGQLVERDTVHLCLSVDHDIVDGAPLMRFAERLKQILRDATALLPVKS